MVVTLQVGVPGGIELILLPVLLLVPLIVAYWVYRDATRYGISYAPAWALATFALLLAGVVPGLLTLVAYLVVREKRSVRPIRPVA
ncbi:hypothetical protein [Halogranum rubrum]|uniref:Uncharacterized protein n=1 Tax=Halogranum salarium B-1 TaxID=1210908 RepID=J3A383_9EURY|nr:hypothetical protein [Halogranum salarium]EJN59823.1 hypothetical protein HSB1_19810 [Halogranum salarium B-1]